MDARDADPPEPDDRRPDDPPLDPADSPFFTQGNWESADEPDDLHPQIDPTPPGADFLDDIFTENPDGSFSIEIELPEGVDWEDIELIAQGDLEEIPESLHSDYEEGPFTKCLVCSQSLQTAQLYQIQKTRRGPETILEMAICFRCAKDLGDEMSEESKETIQRFMQTLVEHPDDPDSCRACAKRPDAVVNATTFAVCMGEFLMMSPVTICDECEDNLQNSLSKATRDRQGQFFRDHFPGIPADLDISPLRVL